MLDHVQQQAYSTSALQKLLMSIIQPLIIRTFKLHQFHRVFEERMALVRDLISLCHKQSLLLGALNELRCSLLHSYTSPLIFRFVIRSYQPAY